MNRQKWMLMNKKGAALPMVLLFLVLFVGLSQVAILGPLHETILTRNELDISQAFQVAQSGAEAAIEQVDTLINNYLQTTISQSSPSGVITYAQGKVSSGDGITWLVYTTRDNNVAALTQNGEEATYAASATLDNGSYSYTIMFTEKEDPSSAGTDAWDFPFRFEINSVGSDGGKSTQVLVNGDFTFRVQRDNFAKFALFTNTQTTQAGSNVWFTNQTNFSGPVHTNDRFNFAFNPSGTFYDATTQVQQTTRFYNSGASVLLDADANGTTDVPTFGSTFTRNTSSVTLSSATDQQDMIDQTTAGGTYASAGIHVPVSGSALSGGIYVNGDSTLSMSVSANNAVYTITQGATTKRITVDRGSSQTTVENLSAGTSSTYSGLPDGVDDAGTIIYVNGQITSVDGIVQEDTALTVASSSDMVITNNVQYSDYTAGSGTPGMVGYVPPTADGTNNILGLVSWGGNVRIGTAAPNNVEIHGSILAQNGVYQVDNYNSGAPRGTATLLGGIISDDYGAFGTFNSATGTQVSGYGRNFVYDDRMSTGTAPPYFPSLSTFIAFTNDIIDKLIWQEGQ
jgi:hypothetical protein